ncbi:amidohydrolase family protein [Flavobacterium sp.]|uniref:amidohydrolase family protein n=1 Tax=Flavobacterium sp. TaxID=239 RepID=UPI00286BD09E|nr:amidohydrolase family protein [Flavobacterium sp.]
MKNIYILLLTFFVSSITIAQHIPGNKQAKSILILNAVAHLGNGKVIEKSAIGFRDGKITIVTQANSIDVTKNKFDITIDASGKHVYPGFIAPNSTLGLVEVDAVKASDDESEIGEMNPHIRSIIAYMADSKVVETMPISGVLLAQITPRDGTISGTSSIVQLDAWNWQDALIKENDGIHMDFPRIYRRTGSKFEPGYLNVNKEYLNQIDKISLFFANSKAYLADAPIKKNLIFDAMKGLFDGSQTLYIHANNEKQIVDAVHLSNNFGVKKVVIVGGYEAYKTIDLLQKNNISVLLKRVHDMPEYNDEDVNLPYKMAKLLTEKGILVGLENSGDKERMNTINLPFQAGTCAAYGLDKEQALQLITSNTAKILGIDSQCGTLEQGKDATLFISEGDALDMRTNKISQAFIQGRILNLDNHQTKLFAKYKAKFNQK